MEKKKSSFVYLSLVVIVLILVNVLSEQFSLRIDLTEDGRYTLSKATKDILRNLDEPVTVKAYFTKKDIPPQYLDIRKNFKDMLVEFNEISDGNVVYEFIDPNEKAELEQEAMQNGIQPVLIQVREKDQMKQIKAYLGAVLSYGDMTDNIPFVTDATAMEYALASSIKKISSASKPVVGIIRGHGEPSLAAMQQAQHSLAVLYSVEEVMMTDSTDLSKYKTIAILAPKESIPDSHLMIFENYLARGGNIFIGINRVDGNMETFNGEDINTGLERWLASKGLVVENNFVIDQSCATINVTQQSGMFRFARPMKFFYWPFINTFNEHPVTKGLEQVFLKFASTLTFTGDTSIRFTPLAMTSKKSSTLSSPLMIDLRREWVESDFMLSNLNVGGILSGNLSGNSMSRMIVVTDGDFAVNGEGQMAQQLPPDNISLFVNSVDWLSDDTGLIELRTKGITTRPIDEMEDGRKQFLKWLNFLLPILIIIIYGFFLNQKRKTTRIRRMQEGYVY
jgi:gliding-associated putative ABC transporter substrate-binding component GldG